FDPPGVPFLAQAFAVALALAGERLPRLDEQPFLALQRFLALGQKSMTPVELNAAETEQRLLLPALRAVALLRDSVFALRRLEILARPLQMLLLELDALLDIGPLLMKLS